MKKIALLLLGASLLLAACGSSAEKLNEAGNAAFAADDLAAALEQYSRAMTEDPALAAPAYNSANVHYRLEDYPAARQSMQSAMLKADAELTQHGYFNLGNALYLEEDFAGAVDAYTEALRLNPQDQDAKVNLELALNRLQDQQEQEQQEQEQEQEQEQDEQTEEEQAQQQVQEQNQSSEQNNSEQENSDQQESEEQNPEEENSEQQQDQSGEQQEQQPDSEQQQEQQEQGNEPQDQAEPTGEDTADQQQDAGNGEPEKNSELPTEAEPQPTPGGQSSPEDEPQPLQATGPIQLDGLTEEQARQLLVAASQDTETLQEYLQQMYVFPYAEVDQDW